MKMQKKKKTIAIEKNITLERIDFVEI